MKALLLKANFDTGERSGGCCPHDKNLHGHPTWQCQKQGLEIRIVKNGRVDDYRDLEGVTVLEDEEEIRAAAQRYFCNPEPEYHVFSDSLMVESIKQLGINLAEIPQDPIEMVKALYAKGVHGIAEQRANPIDPSRMIAPA